MVANSLSKLFGYTEEPGIPFTVSGTTHDGHAVDRCFSLAAVVRQRMLPYRPLAQLVLGKLCAKTGYVDIKKKSTLRSSAWEGDAMYDTE